MSLGTFLLLAMLIIVGLIILWAWMVTKLLFDGSKAFLKAINDFTARR